MTQNADKPAYPDPMRGAEQSYTNQSPWELQTGLTKREYFAAMAMQGLLSNLKALRDMGFKDSEIPEFAIIQANELLNMLGE